jgi:hypothetical protein
MKHNTFWIKDIAMKKNKKIMKLNILIIPLEDLIVFWTILINESKKLLEYQINLSKIITKNKKISLIK